MTKHNLKKEDLSLDLSKKIGLSHLYSKKIIDDLLDVLSQCIKEDNLNLKNLGSFKLIKKDDRIGRNPKTMEEHIIKSRKSLSFKASKNLLNKINT